MKRCHGSTCRLCLAYVHIAHMREHFHLACRATAACMHTSTTAERCTHLKAIPRWSHAILTHYSSHSQLQCACSSSMIATNCHQNAASRQRLPLHQRGQRTRRGWSPRLGPLGALAVRLHHAVPQRALRGHRGRCGAPRLQCLRRIELSLRVTTTSSSEVLLCTDLLCAALRSCLSRRLAAPRQRLPQVKSCPC